MAIRIPLSGDTSSKHAPIPITATTNGGAQTVHTATSTSGEADDLWFSVVNTTSADITLTLMENGSTEPANTSREEVIYANKCVRLYDGIPKSGGLVLKAYASATGLNIVDHWANRYATGA